MQYNGGKTRIARHIAPIVNSARNGLFCWEPFCGALGITEHLKPDFASDSHAGLIALYNTLRKEPDWLDKFDCTEDAYRIAKSWPDDDPGKAFIGFACSFGGKWFGGFAKPNASHPRGFADAGRKLLARKLASVTCALETGSFFEVAPTDGYLIYCDPPYHGTTGYAGVPAFDSGAFADRCVEWAAAGSTVFVSEYSFPVGREVWSRESTSTQGAGVQGGKRHTERLYRLGPSDLEFNSADRVTL